MDIRERMKVAVADPDIGPPLVAAFTLAIREDPVMLVALVCGSMRLRELHLEVLRANEAGEPTGAVQEQMNAQAADLMGNLQDLVARLDKDVLARMLAQFLSHPGELAQAREIVEALT